MNILTANGQTYLSISSSMSKAPPITKIQNAKGLNAHTNLNILHIRISLAERISRHRSSLSGGTSHGEYEASIEEYK